MNSKILLFFTILYFASRGGVESKEVCYDDYGCFDDRPPFSGSTSRPVSLLPESPEKIGTKFILFNRNDRLGTPISKNSPIPSAFDSKLPVVLLCHGFVESSNVRWMLDLRTALLRADNVNVIKVDWGKGNGFPYTQATANTRLVGVEIAKLIEYLVEKKGINLSDVHLIGHSLGAHISGYAGKRVPGIGRITGLDPAGPYFENVDKVVRLDKGDASFVDIIHSDAETTIKVGLGIGRPIGHVDFYPNSGMDQPKCPKTPEKVIKALFGLVTVSVAEFEKVACSHLAAVYHYIDSIETYDKSYTSYKCNSYDDFIQGKCSLKCSKQCNEMGHRASPNKELGTLYLNTLSTVDPMPYHLQNYRISLTKYKASRKNQARGFFNIYFETTQHLTTVETLDDNAVTFLNTGTTENRLVSLGKAIVGDGEVVKRAYINYKRTSNALSAWIYDTEWVFDKVDIFDGERQLIATLCPTNRQLNQIGTTEYALC